MKHIITTLSIFTLLISCKDNKTTTEETTMETKKETTLKEVLDDKKNTFEATAPEEKLAIYAEGIADVQNSGIYEKAKKVGDKAPNFKLKNALGKEITLADYLKKGPVVLTWYRGGWCPYCNLTLQRLQEELPNFNAAGANLLALTPEVPDKSMSTKEKHDLQFEVLSDVQNKIGKEYGIIYKLTDAVAESYQKSFGLHEFNGDESNELPLAATYVIDTNGIIRYAFLDAEYRNRAEPSEIIKVLNEL
mgnify:CR=1 FL=1